MKIDLPAEAKAAKLALRAADMATREVRKRWYALRASVGAGGEPTVVEVGQLTCLLWAAEADLARAAARWREVLAERQALPTAERWDLMAMERWASAQSWV